MPNKQTLVRTALLLLFWREVASSFLQQPSTSIAVPRDDASTARLCPYVVQTETDGRHPLARYMKKKDPEPLKSRGFWDNIRDKPGTVALLPCVFLLGIDVLLNLAVLTKRTIEYFVFGQIPSSEPWW